MPASNDHTNKWWILVCPRKTETTVIHFAFWQTDDGNHLIRWDWKQGDDPILILPDAVQGFDPLYLYASVEEETKNAYFGLCYDSQIC